MVRTVISLDPEEKRWLDRQAREERVPMTEIVRRAVRHLRQECEASAVSLEGVLRETSGIWKGTDGLAHQTRLRDEWEESR